MSLYSQEWINRSIEIFLKYQKSIDRFVTIRKKPLKMMKKPFRNNDLLNLLHIILAIKWASPYLQPRSTFRPTLEWPVIIYETIKNSFIFSSPFNIEHHHQMARRLQNQFNSENRSSWVRSDIIFILITCEMIWPIFGS